MEKHCEICGAPLEDNAIFCHKCGNPVHNRRGKDSKESTKGLNQKTSEQLNRSEKKSLEPQGKNHEPFIENKSEKTDQKNGSNKSVMFVFIGVVLLAVVLALLFKTGILSTSDDNGPSTMENPAVINGNDESQETANKGEDPQSEPAPGIQEDDSSDTQNVVDAAEEADDTAQTVGDHSSDDIKEDKLVIDEEYIADGWYTYYLSYLDAINHSGDVSYLKHATDERKKSFKTNYEKYNKGYTFENLSFDVDKTDMKIKDLGNGKLKATCHAYVVNVCTEIATGVIEDNRVTLLGQLEIDSKTGDYVLTLQQSDREFTFGKHEMIHCAD